MRRVPLSVAAVAASLLVSTAALAAAPSGSRPGSALGGNPGVTSPDPSANPISPDPSPSTLTPAASPPPPPGPGHLAAPSGRARQPHQAPAGMVASTQPFTLTSSSMAVTG